MIEFLKNIWVGLIIILTIACLISIPILAAYWINSNKEWQASIGITIIVVLLICWAHVVGKSWRSKR